MIFSSPAKPPKRPVPTPLFEQPFQPSPSPLSPLNFQESPAEPSFPLHFSPTSLPNRIEHISSPPSSLFTFQGITPRPLPIFLASPTVSPPSQPIFHAGPTVSPSSQPIFLAGPTVSPPSQPIFHAGPTIRPSLPSSPTPIENLSTMGSISTAPQPGIYDSDNLSSLMTVRFITPCIFPMYTYSGKRQGIMN